MPKFLTHDPQPRSNAIRSVPAKRSFDEVRDDIKLRKLLQRAVLRQQAPQSLFDSVRQRIRE
jgi:hypothetical protein